MQQAQAQDLSDLGELQNLKTGVLLVKLYTRNQSISKLKDNGYAKKAEVLAKEQHFKSLAIANAFQNNYTFTPKVYFFYSDDSKKVKEGDFDGILMGYDLQVLSNVNIGDSHIYIAEFGHTEVKDIQALIIRDSELNPLESPFPYFTRTFEGIPILERPYGRVVELWNEKLFKKYDKYFIPIEKSQE